MASASDSPEATPHRRLPSRLRFYADLSQCLFDFVIQLLPTQEEMQVKEDVRKLLERLIRTIEPNSRLLSFGSTANGFSLRNSDMDLCCLIDSDERLSATDLVVMLGDLLERETKFHVKPLPHARIPIVKLSLDPSPGLPLGIACDIGFENRLALENTRLLMCYAMIDPTRVRTMVLFLKVWSKRRKINSPYKGTLSSYGYVLLVIYFLVHVKNPPVLPNLQQMPPLRPISKEDTHVAGYNTWFFDDIELLKTRWHSENTESVAELLIDFFRYYARDFIYNTGVASIRAGLLKKTSKGWQNDLSASRYHDSRERNRLCIEDPFELDFNVGRCVTKDGIYTIRGEFMRASRILANRPERAVLALAELCAERPDEDLVSPPTSSTFGVSRPPPQTPYTVGSGSGRAKPPSPPTISVPISVTPSKANGAGMNLPAPPNSSHMAPRRSKWTSPPPPGAPDDARALFESNLGHGLELATSSTGAREREHARESTSESASEGTSEVFTDTDASASDAGSDVVSVRSFTEGVAVRQAEQGPAHGNGWRRPSWHTRDARTPPMHQQQQHLGVDNIYYGTSGRLSTGARGRNQRERERAPVPASAPPTSWMNDPGTSRRSLSGPPRAANWAPTVATTSSGVLPPLPPSPESPHSHSPSGQHFSPRFVETTHTVFYQTSPRPSPQSSPRPNVYPAASASSSSSSFPAGAGASVPQFLTNSNIIGIRVPSDVFPTNHPPLSLSLSSSSTPREHTPVPKVIPGGPKPPSPSWTRIVSQHTQGHHSRSPSTNAPTPKPHSHSVFLQQQQATRVLNSSNVLSDAPLPPNLSSPSQMPTVSISFGEICGPPDEDNDNDAEQFADFSSATSSPTPSLSTGYETSVSLSPSPSPSPPLPSGGDPATAAQPKSPASVEQDGETPTEPSHKPVSVSVPAPGP